MADNASEPKGTPPPLPAPGTTGAGMPPAADQTTKKGQGKVVVLSSVAKAPPAATQAITNADAPPQFSEPELKRSPMQVKPAPVPVVKPVSGANVVRPTDKPEVKAPVKKSRWSFFSGSPVSEPEQIPVSKAKPPPLPVAKSVAPKGPDAPESEAKKLSSRLVPTTDKPKVSATPSVFDDVEEPETPPEWKPLEPGELTVPGGVSLETFAKSQPDSGATPSAAKPPAIPAGQLIVTLPPIANQPAAPTVLQPPVVLSSGAAIPPPIHVAPPMLKSEGETVSEKLHQPVTPHGEEKTEAPKLKPVPPNTGKVSKVTGPITLREPISPIGGTPTIKPEPVKIVPPIKAEEAKPALKPPVLPDRILAQPKPEEKAKAPVVPPIPTQAVPVAQPVAATPSKPVTPTVPVAEKKPAPLPIVQTAKVLPPTRVERSKKRHQYERIFFYVLVAAVGAALGIGGYYHCRETRVEGQVIPPSGMPLSNEVWIVNDIRDQYGGIVEELAAQRAPAMQEIHYRQDHVNRAQADIAVREERVRGIEGQLKACKDEMADIGKKARDSVQQIWDGPGADIEADYNSHLSELEQAITERAKTLKIKYEPDETYNSPEVWANAYRLALYDVPAGVDTAKEHQWLGDQMKQWRAFLATLDTRKEQLRVEADKARTAPAAKINDLNMKMDDLQHRIDITRADEEPIKAELQQAQTDLAQAQGVEGGLDVTYYKELEALPGANIVKHIPLDPSGRFTWIEDETSFSAGNNEHQYWVFARATRTDGRQYWALGRITVAKDHTVGLIIGRDSFISTKAILRPDLSPEEQAQ